MRITFRLDVKFCSWKLLSLICFLVITLSFGNVGKSEAQSVLPKCVMKGICDDMNNLNCALDASPDDISGKFGIDPTISLAADIEKFCHIKLPNNQSCITREQWEVVHDGLNRAQRFLSGCPACWRNFKMLFCAMSVRPDQSSFLKVRTKDRASRSSSEISTTEDVDRVIELEYYLTDKTKMKLFDSCVNTTFGVAKTKSFSVLILKDSLVTDTFKFFDTLGNKSHYGGGPDAPPFTIFFPRESDPRPANIQPLELDMVPCNHPDFKCHCVHCHDSCPAPISTEVFEKYACTVGVFYCWPFVFIFTYLFGLFAFIFGWYGIRYWVKRKSKKNIDPLSLVNSDYDETLLLKLKDSEKNLNKDGNQEANYVTYTYKLNTFLANYFYLHGKFVARNAWAFIFLTIFIVAMAGFSFLWNSFEIETDPVKLWVGTNSESALQKKYFDESFGPLFRVEQIIITKVNPDDGTRYSMVNRKDISVAVDLMEGIKTNVRDPLTFYTLSDLCYRANGDHCIIQSVTETWTSPELFRKESDDDVKKIIRKCAENYLQCVLDRKLPIPLLPQVIYGGVDLYTLNGKYNPFGNSYSNSAYSSHKRREGISPINTDDYMNAKALIMTLLLENNIRNETLMNAADRWEDALIKYLKDFQANHTEYTFSFMTESSIEKELNRDADANASIIVVSYVVMFVYACLALGRFRSWNRLMIDSRVSLALSGIFIVIASIIISVAFFMALHIKTTLIIAEVIPFLVLAVGIDNIFLLVHAFDRTDMSLSIEERIGITLKSTGPNILLTGVTELLAFAAGAFVSMPAVSIFSLYAAIAILCDFILQLTCFVAFLTLDGLRIQQNRYDIFFWASSKLRLLVPSRRSLEIVAEKFYAPLVLHKKSRPWLIALYLLFLSLSGAGIFYVEVGLDQRLAFPSDSYLISYFDSVSRDLLVGPPLLLVLRNYNVSNMKAQGHIISSFFSDTSEISLGNIFEANRREPNSYLGPPLSNWLDDFYVWLKTDCAIPPNSSVECFNKKILDKNKCKLCLPQGSLPANGSISLALMKEIIENKSNLNGLGFNELVKLFVSKKFNGQIPYYMIYGNSFNWTTDSSNTSILGASYFDSYFDALHTVDDFTNALRSARKLCDYIMEQNRDSEVEADGSSFDLFPYSPFFIFFEQYLTIIEVSLIVIIILLIAIFITNWIILGNLSMALMVIWMIASIVIGMFGLMGWWNISLCAVSLVNVVIAIGISVEFCSNIARSYLIRSGSRKERVLLTLSETGSSVLSGITITKLLGVFVLFFSRSKIFEVFYFRMYFSVVLLGAFHGLLILPLFLSIFGTKYVNSLPLKTNNDGEANGKNDDVIEKKSHLLTTDTSTATSAIVFPEKAGLF